MPGPDEGEPRLFNQGWVESIIANFTLGAIFIIIIIHYLILTIIRGIGLSLKDKYGEVSVLSTASVGCIAPIISSDHAHAGFIWMVKSLYFSQFSFYMR